MKLSNNFTTCKVCGKHKGGSFGRDHFECSKKLQKERKTFRNKASKNVYSEKRITEFLKVVEG